MLVAVDMLIDACCGWHGGCPQVAHRLPVGAVTVAFGLQMCWSCDPGGPRARPFSRINFPTPEFNFSGLFVNFLKITQK